MPTQFGTLDGIIGCQARYPSEVERFLRGEAAVEQEQLLRAPHPDHAREEPGVATVGGEAERAITKREPRVLGRNDDVGDIDQAQPAAAHATAHRSDNGRVDAGQPFEMIAVERTASI